MAPADSLARLRKTLMDRAERREAPVTQLCREAGVSRSRFYELQARYRAYGETGLRPKPRPADRPGPLFSRGRVDGDRNAVSSRHHSRIHRRLEPFDGDAAAIQRDRSLWLN